MLEPLDMRDVTYLMTCLNCDYTDAFIQTLTNNAFYIPEPYDTFVDVFDYMSETS